MNPIWYVFGTLFFTVFGQVILKWRLLTLRVNLPNGIIEKIVCLIKLTLDPFILLGFLSAFLASLFWIAAMTKLELTTAYPLMSLAPAIVFVLGICFLGEVFTIGKLLGLILIIVGGIVTVKY